MNYCPVIFFNYCPVTDRQTDRRTDRQTESDAYEPTVQCAQVGSKTTYALKTPHLIFLRHIPEFLLWQVQVNGMSQ